MVPRSQRKSPLWSIVLAGLCWAIIGLWFITWIVLLPKRGLGSSLDITNPSLLGVAAVSSLFFLLGHFAFLSRIVAGMVATALMVVGLGFALDKYLSTRPISLDAGEPLVATFQVPLEFRRPVSGVVIKAPVRSRELDKYQIEMTCGDSVVGKRRPSEIDDVVGWTFVLVQKSTEASSQLEPGATCRASIVYLSDVEFFKPLHEWIFLQSESPELDNYSIDIEPAVMIDLDY